MTYRFFPYYFNESAQVLQPIKYAYSKPYSSIHSGMSHGMRDSDELSNAVDLFGPCQIEVPYKGILGIFIDEVLSPFYIFQVSSRTRATLA